MADTSVPITAGSGTPIRVLSGLGAGTADQQVVTTADKNGTLQGSSSTGTNSSVAGTTSASTTILASNTARVGASIFNDSTAVLYLSRGATCATTNYSVQVQPGGFYELPETNVYTGVITGVWASAVGNARVTEDT